MTDTLPQAVDSAFDDHEAFEASEEGYRVTTTVFDATVTATDIDGVGYQFTVTVRAPMLREAVGNEVVGPAVEDGWFETYERRLEDATMATRSQVDLEEYTVEDDGGQAVARFVFEYGDANRGAEIAKTIVEYVEGTYVEGVIPGYDYESPVADLLHRAKTTGSDAERGGTPL
ncbi:DUF5813 family protein [Halorhabdus amylolytica]|uniref:DUF5813 family protein n=1 Tax=Halorhabdus amylolytica TaxID=2559573 RepID=UPI0010A9BA3D|nr:DUF5813 family protein [Halorhabdus amylolytica]